MKVHSQLKSDEVQDKFWPALLGSDTSEGDTAPPVVKFPFLSKRIKIVLCPLPLSGWEDLTSRNNSISVKPPPRSSSLCCAERIYFVDILRCRPKVSIRVWSFDFSYVFISTYLV